MIQWYEVRVLGPLPEKARVLLGATLVGDSEARTVLGTVAADPPSLSAAISRLARLGLEVAEVRRDPCRTEVEVSGPLGPVLQAALADVAVAMARQRCVLSLRMSGKTLAAALHVLTEQGVDLVSVRAATA